MDTAEEYMLTSGTEERLLADVFSGRTGRGRNVCAEESGGDQENLTRMSKASRWMRGRRGRAELEKEVK